MAGDVLIEVGRHAQADADGSVGGLGFASCVFAQASVCSFLLGVVAVVVEGVGVFVVLEKLVCIVAEELLFIVGYEPAFHVGTGGCDGLGGFVLGVEGVGVGFAFFHVVVVSVCLL